MSVPSKKMFGRAGVVAIVLGLLVCELPLGLAALGLGGAGVGIYAFHPPLLLEVGLFAVGALAIILFLFGLIRRRRHAD